jgi:predicted DNA-binding transcriptional regulator AlpA
MSTTPATPDRLLTIAEAAHLAGFPQTTLHAWQRAHIGPPTVRLGGQRFYRADRLLAWLEAWWPTRVEQFTHRTHLLVVAPRGSAAPTPHQGRPAA